VESGDAAGGLFVVADGEHPLLFQILALGRDRALRRACLGLGTAAADDQVADVYRFIAANDDVVAAGAEGVAGLDQHLVIAGVADHLQPARDAPSMDVAVVKFVLLDDVVVEAVEVGFGEELSGEEARAAQALESAADRAGRAGVLRRLRLSLPRETAVGR
jgi:hypothetical protein